jgi:CRP-like cAMP-binding protein/Fe-S-cluster-containing hydrogenase component 2
MSDSRSVLAELAERDVMACIGCNDCMLACPLPLSNTVTVAELNAAVHLPVITQPNVISFVAACTQCRQCVPACPADLSRADMVLFNKVKVEDAVPNYQLMLQVGFKVVPSPWSLDEMAAKLQGLPLFEGTSPGDLRRLLLKTTLRQLRPGEVLCREGEFFDRLCIVLHGSLEQTVAGPRGMRVHVLVLQPGSFFGELAILNDQPEPYTAHALEPAVVVEIPRAAVKRTMEASAPFRATMQELYRRRALWTYARMPSVFGHLPERAVEELLSQAELTMLKSGEALVKEGGAPKGVHLTRSGFLRVSQGQGAEERVLVYLREGDLFGAHALLAGERALPYSVTATTRSEVVTIPPQHFFRVLQQYPQARQVLESAAYESERTIRSSLFRAPVGGAGKKDATRVALSMDVLVEKGLATGSEVLVIDQNLCTHCQNCVDACGRRHKYSRLQLRGLQVENLLFPTACRHCEDPVCLLCSVNGIVRLPSGEITIVENNCIGCGACAERCPYGNISMHPVQQKKPGMFVSLMDFIRGKTDRERAMAELDPAAARRAVKCDLCAGFADYACVTACPVGAAARIDPLKVLKNEAMVVGLEMRRSGA